MDKNQKEVRSVNKVVRKNSKIIYQQQANLNKRLNDLEAKIPKEKDRMPHFGVSIIKSILRFVAYTYLLNANISMFAQLMIAAEVVGVLEEVVDV